MENLTKQQIILLTLLVSFVTSIATGIVTVALMNQTPVGVTQTINRVIERTIQQVTSPATSTTQTSGGTIKETVVVSEDDQVVSAVNTNAKSIVRIYRTNTDPTSSQSIVLVSLGAVITSDGVIATDNSIIDAGGNYFTTADNGNLIKLSVVRALSGEQIALLQIQPDAKNPLTVTTVPLSTQGDLQLGQAVIYLGGATKNSVATGIVSSLATAAADASSTVSTTVTAIQTSLNNTLTSGALLLNLSGQLVGLKTTYLDSDKTDLFAPTSDIQTELTALQNSQKKS